MPIQTKSHTNNLYIICFIQVRLTSSCEACVPYSFSVSACVFFNEFFVLRVTSHILTHGDILWFSLFLSFALDFATIKSKWRAFSAPISIRQYHKYIKRNHLPCILFICLAFFSLSLSRSLSPFSIVYLYIYVFV